MSRTTKLLAAAAIALCASGGAASAQGYYYGEDCHDQNAATGTIVGAIAGGIIGNQFGRGGGRTAATAGGVILGGMAGNQIAGDMDCDDRREAFRVYYEGLDGPIGERHEWRRRGGRWGYFTPTREYYDGPVLCRDFEEGVWRDEAWRIHTGTACRESDGNWHFR